AAPGLAGRDGRSVASMPPGKLAGLEGLVWEEALEAGMPVRVLKEADAALMGGAWKGAAAGARDAVLLTLGTGVGGAIISDGRLVEGHIGRAGHLGHICLDPDGPASIAGMPGSLEHAIGNGTVAERSKGRFQDTRALVEAHVAGDSEASEIWLRSVWVLACAVASIVNAVDPEVVILGGGIALAGPALFDPLAKLLERVEWRPGGRTVRVVPATLGDVAGALGAARGAMKAAGAAAGPAADYLERCRGLVDAVAAQQPEIRRAADWFAEAILAGGIRARGLKVVAIVSLRHSEASQSRHPRGVKLPDVADLVLDTGAPAGDAMVNVPGLATPVSPGSTVGGCLLVNAVKAEVADRLTRAGRPPKVLTAPALVGAKASEALFEAAYDEHARRMARLYAGLGSDEDSG